MSDEMAGALRERVAIEAWTDVRDEAGAVAGYWQGCGLAFAAVTPDAAAVRNVAGEARRSTRRWRVTLRRPVAVGLTSRLIWQGLVLSILAVEDDARLPDRVVLRCEARAA